MFDFTVFASFPRGLYLVEQLSHAGFKTAYAEVSPPVARPFPVFLDDRSEKAKHFLQSLGFLNRQKAGLCVLSPEGVWPLQDMRDMADRHSVIKNGWRHSRPEDFKDFSKDWLSRLSLNLAGRVFDGNCAVFSSDRLNLFSDCFLFSPSLRKIKEFKRDHPGISFYSLPANSIFWDERGESFIVSAPQNGKSSKEGGFQKALPNRKKAGHRFESESRKYIWLCDLPPLAWEKAWVGASGPPPGDGLSPAEEGIYDSAKQIKQQGLPAPSVGKAAPKAKVAAKAYRSSPVFGKERGRGLKPLWQWRAGFLKADFGDYESLIPSHFILIKDVFLPWSHDNLFSIFHHSGVLEVWSRQAFDGPPASFLPSASAQLGAFFKGGRFSLMERQALEGMPVYGPEALQKLFSSEKSRLYVEDLGLFFQGDLGSLIQAEEQLFESSKAALPRKKKRKTS